MGTVRTLSGCTLELTDETLDMLSACRTYAKLQPFDLTITHGTDGTHSGAVDPHPFGKALDVRTHDLPDPDATIVALASRLGAAYTVILEDRGLPNEHIHIQLRKDLWRATVPAMRLAVAVAADTAAGRRA